MPRPSTSRRPTVSIVGPGNLGSALALSLVHANYRIQSIAIRPQSTRKRQAKAIAQKAGARVVTLGAELLDGDIVWLTVPDDAIGNVARRLARSQTWQGRIIFHSSGALTSDELGPLRQKGASVASVHPMMTFVRGGVPDMAGVAFALEGDARAVRFARSIVRDLAGKPVAIRKESKVLYHAFGSFASPLVVALMATLEQVALAAGIRQQDIKPTMAPLLSQTLRNYLKQDAASAFTGPLVRGDVTTIRKHLGELKKLPEARQVYVALVRASLNALPVKNRRSIERELSRG